MKKTGTEMAQLLRITEQTGSRHCMWGVEIVNLRGGEGYK